MDTGRREVGVGGQMEKHPFRGGVEEDGVKNLWRRGNQGRGVTFRM